MTLPISFTAVLERSKSFTGEFATEPYEVAWAHEARFFIRVLDDQAGAAWMELRTQISPDGLHWCDLDDIDHVTPHSAAENLYSWAVSDFGGWLRVSGRVVSNDQTAEMGDGAAVKAMISLALKA